MLGLFLFLGCSKEEPAPLPPVEKVELPKSTTGLYMGRLPCENCKANMVQLELKEDSSATALQKIVLDSTETDPKVDTLHGTFSMNGDILSVSLSNGSILWKFKQGTHGSFALLTGAGTVYEDENGMKADFIKIYKIKMPKNGELNAVPDSSH